MPELLLCADSMNAALDVLKPHIKVEGQVKNRTASSLARSKVISTRSARTS